MPVSWNSVLYKWKKPPVSIRALTEHLFGKSLLFFFILGFCKHQGTSKAISQQNHYIFSQSVSTNTLFPFTFKWGFMEIVGGIAATLGEQGLVLRVFCALQEPLHPQSCSLPLTALCWLQAPMLFKIQKVSSLLSEMLLASNTTWKHQYRYLKVCKIRL